MEDRFFTQPVLNAPYSYPARHWELDDDGQPTQQIIERRRIAEFITPIPKPRRRRVGSSQQQLVFDRMMGCLPQSSSMRARPRSSTRFASTLTAGTACPTLVTGA